MTTIRKIFYLLPIMRLLQGKEGFVQKGFVSAQNLLWKCKYNLLSFIYCISLNDRAINKADYLFLHKSRYCAFSMSLKRASRRPRPSTRAKENKQSR